MKTTIKHSAIVSLLAFSFTASAQESTLPEDFNLPKNTVKAVISYGDFTIPQQQFAIRPSHSTYTFQEGKIINYQYRDSTSMIKTDMDYHYENGQLKRKETIESSRAGMKYKTHKYRTENEGYKTTFYRTYHWGETDKYILFYNEAGELRGKSFYNIRGVRATQTEYGGKEGYRIKKYHNGKVMSEITHSNNDDGKLTKTVTYVMPGEEDEVKVMTLYYYNLKGDPRQMVDFVTEKKNSGQKPTKTTYVNYLYDGDIWVAKIEYGTATKNPGKIVATIRTLETPEKTYHAPSDEQLKTFCQETYQKYLKL
ncbi:hypothetical protein COR50_11865 [Chitinophaga caeni]|uniref:DUF4595 domain-containing protein n=1 Tax=Chitinophaga caeni TaxID=2029983 RepID=A0A291QV35_9BACT|nr:hypothetical protein [Chitinophaga caeni]ATL47806.1 hypothetical protein COR50_11865 [Chitinophaga caeni]